MHVLYMLVEYIRAVLHGTGAYDLQRLAEITIGY